MVVAVLSPSIWVPGNVERLCQARFGGVEVECLIIAVSMLTSKPFGLGIVSSYLLKIRQHSIPVPCRIRTTKLCPAVILAAGASDQDHPVDRRAPSDTTSDPYLLGSVMHVALRCRCYVVFY